MTEPRTLILHEDDLGSHEANMAFIEQWAVDMFRHGTARRLRDAAGIGPRGMRQYSDTKPSR